jgi:hypothetical protein
MNLRTQLLRAPASVGLSVISPLWQDLAQDQLELAYRLLLPV